MRVFGRMLSCGVKGLRDRMSNTELLVWFVLIMGVMSLYVTGCGPTYYKYPSGGGPGGSDIPPEVQSVVTESCATSSCHAGGKFSDLSGGNLKRGNSLVRINSSSRPMPPSGTKEEGIFVGEKKARLIAYLQGN